MANLISESNNKDVEESHIFDKIIQDHESEALVEPIIQIDEKEILDEPIVPKPEAKTDLESINEVEEEISHYTSLDPSHEPSREQSSHNSDEIE